jgi:ferrous iron transport protein B
MRKIALIGNPNTGKSSLFNRLTGLRQHVGNYPGITLDKKWGETELAGGGVAHVLDLPGVYSVFPRSNDERVVIDILSNPEHPDFPELVVVVADASNLERNLLLYSQVHDLGLPMVLALTMDDVNRKNGIYIDKKLLSTRLGGVSIVTVNARTGDGILALKEAIESTQAPPASMQLPGEHPARIKDNPEAQRIDAENRLVAIRQMLIGVVRQNETKPQSRTRKLDSLLVHRFWGYAIFLGILLLIFQFIFRIAAVPMDFIEGLFLQLADTLSSQLSPGIFTDLLTEGIVPGIGGVVVFIPQIAILFFFLSLLEESGYMARVVFLMDRLVRPFGLNGKSVVPLMSSVACAIPGVMATRTINSWKDRLITILVAPLMSCSARIPVYTLLIALVVPDRMLWGIIDLKGLVLLGLYALGLFSALAVAFVMKSFIKTGEPSFLILEMPNYRWPRWKEVGINLMEKVRVFVWDAGRVILSISVILWVFASYGPASWEETTPIGHEITLEESYIGKLGQTIEPVIKPLGYDWKMGVSLITSFAAREVFVGSMATIYSIGEETDNQSMLVERLKQERWSDSGKPVYTLASGLSLMVFYVYAMQCMATFAVVKRETKSWKWPIFQLVYMGVLAYLAAFLTFQMFN